jgi:hypothetical protein
MTQIVEQVGVPALEAVPACPERVARQGWLRVDAPDEESALSLIDRLDAFHAELGPGHGSRCEVQIELGPGGDERLAEALVAVEHWLAGLGLSTVQMKLDGRRFLLEARAA